ncbi:FIST N-terminal domain-containing protein [Propionivibrio sp.]|uniref:FIST N-terminal domain-containing protein n=1 Tax=Propionivibrio sp. TaxID=2212460 RepID=UPI0025F0E413|nr:FIST N-terminal domain-containing protein [Propionivibrio sp.]MBK7356308.1 hypothetical protein [Propionivibrio sp.]
MRAISSSTIITDPYRAGIALGESLATMSPEVVFLFSSIDYSVPELLEGLHDALDHDDVIVVGNSSNGFYETTVSSDRGAAVLGLNSDGQVRWRLAHAERLNENLHDKVEELMAMLSVDGETPCLGYLVSDFRVDASRIEAALRESVSFPVVGGLADDYSMQSSYIYVNREVFSDALVVLAAYGDLRFSIRVGNSLQAIGRSGRIDAIEGTQLHRVDGLNAKDFIERETGRTVLQTDRGTLSLLVHDAEVSEEKCLRSIIPDLLDTEDHLVCLAAFPEAIRCKCVWPGRRIWWLRFTPLPKRQALVERARRPRW